MDAVFSLPFADLPITPDLLIPILNQTAFLLVGTIVGLIFYAFLTDRAVFEGLGRVRSEKFGWWDAVIASGLVIFFVFLVATSLRAGEPAEDPSVAPDAQRTVEAMVGVAVIFLLFCTGILAALRLRHISWRETFGLTRLGVLGILGRAALLLLLAYPLIIVASTLSQILLAAGGDDDNSAQELVRFFVQSDVQYAKWVVAISAMVIAPMYEEFIFRGYIYGVVRRYGGVTVGVLFNAALFASIHVHLPSFAPLFVLAVCLSLAYEWTGSLWVPMCMHAMFNSLTVINLLFNGKDV